MISLEQLLESRDRRAAHQLELLKAFPQCSLICLTVQLPGPVKRSAGSLLIGGAGLAVLLNRFGSVLRHVQVKDLDTGYEAYLAVPLDAGTVKRICCEMEDTHPLGRLMDMDVLELTGGVAHRLERTSLGLPPRKCLMCDNEVRYCMRARRHTQAELMEKISQMINAYVNE